MSRRIVHENPWFSISLREAGDQQWFRVERADSAMLIGLDARGELLMLEGTRDTTGQAELYELPCGSIEPGEDPAAAAARETREETGWSASGLALIGSFVESPGISAARCHVFSATVSPGSNADLEPGEDWTAVTLPFPEVFKLVTAGRIQDAGTLAALAVYHSRSL